MIIKPGVQIAGLRREMQMAIDYAEDVYEKFGHTLIMTDGYDDQKKIVRGRVKNSKHYSGEAFDIRIWNVGADLHRIFGRLKKGLEPLGFDILLENDHIHIEYDPKRSTQCL
jgi:uncharacterized protein YcbK (DUF882 family)